MRNLIIKAMDLAFAVAAKLLPTRGLVRFCLVGARFARGRGFATLASVFVVATAFISIGAQPASAQTTLFLFERMPNSAVEGGEISFSIGRTGTIPTTQNVTLRISQSGDFVGGITPFIDNTAIFNDTVPANGSATVNVTLLSDGSDFRMVLSVKDNDIDEVAVGNITIEAVAGTGITPGTMNNRIVLTIYDNDPAISLSAPASVLEGDNVTVTVLAELPASEVTQNHTLEISVNDIGGVLVGGSRTLNNVSIMAGTNSTDIEFETIENTMSGDSGSFSVTIQTENTDGYSRGSVWRITVPVQDDDIGLTLTPMPFHMFPEGGTHQVQLNITPPQAQEVEVIYYTADSTPIGAIAGEDYTAIPASNPGRITIPASTASVNFTISTTDDNINEGYEGLQGFDIRANATVGGVNLTTGGTYYIFEDDSDPQLKVMGPELIAAGRNSTFRVVSSTGSTNPIPTVNPTNATVNMRATGGFAAIYNGTDRIAADPSGTTDFSFILPALAEEASFVVEAEAGDNVSDIVLTLQDAASGVPGYIFDMNEMHSLTAQVVNAGIAFDALVGAPPREGETVTLTVNVLPVQQTDTVIRYRTERWFVGGVAVSQANEDYPPIDDGQITIAAGASSGNISVVLPDNVVALPLGAPQRQFRVVANATISDGSSNIAAGDGIAVTIRDNDEVPTLGLRSPTRIQPGQNGTFTIYSNRTSLAVAQSIDVTVSGDGVVAIYNGSASPIVPASAGASTDITVVMPARALQTSFTVQASATENTSIVAAITDAAGAGNNYVLLGGAENATASVMESPLDVAKLNQAVLPQVAITVLDEVGQAISRRAHDSFGDDPDTARRGFTINDNSALGFLQTLAKREATLDAAENPWDAPDADSRSRGLLQLPDTSDLALSFRPGEGTGGLAIWAQGFSRNVEETRNGITLDGDIPGAVIGVDTRLNDSLLAGVGFSAVTTELDYRVADETDQLKGTHETEMSTIHPYIGWRTDGGASLWGSLGIGEGEVTITPADAEVYIGEIEMQSFGAGFTTLGEARRDGATSLALNFHGDVNWAAIEESPNARTRGSDAYREATTNEMDVGRVRLGATLTHNQAWGDGNFRQEFDLAVRHDSGDLAEGGAIELGAGVGFDMASGFRFDLSARTLLTHEESVDEWGVSGGVHWASRPGGQGFALSVTPQWGNTASQADTLLNGNLDALTPADSDAAAASYAFDVRYGIPILRHGLLTPFITGDGGDLTSATRGMQFSNGGIAAGVEADSDENSAFIRYSRDF